MHHLQSSIGTELLLGPAGCIEVPERPKEAPTCVMLDNIHTDHPVNGNGLLSVTSVPRAC